MKAYFQEMFRSKSFLVAALVTIALLVARTVYTNLNTPPSPPPAPTAVPTPESPYDRGWQEVEVPSLDYTHERAVMVACDERFFRYAHPIEFREEGSKGIFSIKTAINVEVLGVKRGVEIQTTRSGVDFINASDFPEGEIRDEYFSKVLREYPYTYYMEVELQPEPNLDSLTTPARVWCERW